MRKQDMGVYISFVWCRLLTSGDVTSGGSSIVLQNELRPSVSRVTLLIRATVLCAPAQLQLTVENELVEPVK
jgi:hypothetical protein